MIHFEIHKDWDKFNQDIWNGLGAETVFQTFEWHRAWWRAYGEGRELLIVACWDDNALKALAPFMLVQEKERRILRFIGDERSDYANFIYKPGGEAVVEQTVHFLKTISHLWDRMELNNIPSYSSVLKALRLGAKRDRLSICVGLKQPCPTLLLAGHESAARKMMDKKSIRYCTRYFEQHQGLKFIHTRDPKEIWPHLNAFFYQHILRWSVKDSPSLFVLRQSRDFYRCLVEDMAPSGNMIFSAAFSGGDPIAFHFGFIDRERFYLYKPSFDIALSRHSPGLVLLKAMVDYALEAGCKEFDFTRGEESFKARFSNKVRYNVSVRITKDASEAFSFWLQLILKKVFLVRKLRDFWTRLGQVFYVLLNKCKILEHVEIFSAPVPSEQFFNREDTVRSYAAMSGLEKPENKILHFLRQELKTMRMLDMGVGIGRTSVYFLNLVKDYVAFDVAENMVRAGKDIVGDLVEPTNFLHGDARRMRVLDDVSFDFVLMGSNVIDSVSLEDRIRVFQEVRRVAKKGAWFCFSSHNLQSLNMRGVTGVGSFLTRLRRHILFTAANEDLRHKKPCDFTFVRDPDEHAQILLCYIAPSAQARQLEEFGFKDIRVFSLETGHEIHDRQKWDELTDNRVYYLCRV